jgi:predicted nucleic-acid-binding protein
MTGLDTNVLVRYIAQDDAKQSARATRFIESECTTEVPGFISLVTLVEIVWVSESCYGAGKTEVLTLLRHLLSTKQLVVQDCETVWKALNLFEKGNAEFADYLVERIADANGCESTVTFDRKAAQAGMKLLS